MARVTVVGGGVVGLTAALRLAQAGHAVRCVRDAPVADTVSAVAGGLWFPYHVEPRERVAAWGAVALEAFTSLATDPSAGVALREGVVVERSTPDRWWTAGVPSWREATTAELPAGATGGVVATVPLVTMPVFLPWLEARCAEAGVELVHGRVDDLAEVSGDVVVVAAGLRSGALLGDDAPTPSLGQVALLANPGLRRWVVDDDHPDGMVYALPHPGWVVCGGTDVGGAWDTEPDAAVHAAIVARVRSVVPALTEADVLGARVGLRPVAPSVRLARESLGGREVVTDYGHGGAGVTLSWGCAE
ncbi:MAG TPA: FAD-dependent oxidoreductase, partial [Ornithinibacter sp.]|nr:FAD-dependent oxidoreductase [Ornithinibacter sp.]